MTADGLLHLGRFDIDLNGNRLYKDGAPVHLTRTEWALLQELVRRPGQILGHRTLLQHVWGDVYGEESDYVHTYMRRLRRKLEDNPADPAYLLTEPGIGYLFQAPDEATASANATTAPGRRRPRTVNLAPLDSRDRFVGRLREQEALAALLAEPARLISIYGRGGIGKTALACKVLNDIADGRLPIALDGIVYQSAAHTGLNVRQIFSDFRRFLSESDQAELDALPADPRGLMRAITFLLEKLNGGSYVLLLDNIETIQNPLTGELPEEMTQFVRSVVEQRGAIHLLITSREPLTLPRSAKTWERPVPLNEGLSLSDAVQMLRLCDPDGAAGLREADDSALQEIAEKIGRFPRALEAVAGLLLEKPLLRPEDLLHEEGLLSAEIGQSFVQNTIERLDARAVRVMEGLALFGRPVGQKALEALLSPFLPAAELPDILNRLVRAYFCAFSRASQTFAMHPIDQDYCTSRIPLTDGGDGYTCSALHRRAAEYYAQQRLPPEEWETLADLEPIMAEFEHRASAGDPDAAARLALMIDQEHLHRWGYYDELSRMYEQIQGRVADHWLSDECRLRQGEAFRALGRIHDAVICFEQAVDAAIDAVQRGAALNSLGRASYDLGNFSDAGDFWRRALKVFRETGDRSGEAGTHGGLGWVSYLLGHYDEAVESLEQALAIFRALGSRYQVGVNLGDLGQVRAARGEFQPALAALRESLSIAREVNSTREQSYKGGYLAAALLIGGDLEAARQAAGEAGQVREPGNDHFIAVLQGLMAKCSGHPEEAVTFFERARGLASSLIEQTRGFYRAHYTLALALAGLAVVHRDPPEAAMEAYLRARAICSAKGVLDLNRRLLDLLLVSVPDPLAQTLRESFDE